MSKIYCFSCRQAVSTELPDDFIFRATATCPECELGPRVELFNAVGRLGIFMQFGNKVEIERSLEDGRFKATVTMNQNIIGQAEHGAIHEAINLALWQLVEAGKNESE